MLEPIDLRDFNDFLKENERPSYIHLVLPGVVVSGQVDDVTKEIIRLGDVSINGMLQTLETAVLIVPRERILAWGKGKIKIVDKA